MKNQALLLTLAGLGENVRIFDPIVAAINKTTKYRLHVLQAAHPDVLDVPIQTWCMGNLPHFTSTWNGWTVPEVIRPAPLFVAGYSYGGDRAYELVQYIRSNPKRFNPQPPSIHVYLIDPVRREGEQIHAKPYVFKKEFANTVRCYKRTPWMPPISSEVDIVASAGVDVVNHTYFRDDHVSIMRNPEVVRSIAEHVNKILLAA